MSLKNIDHKFPKEKADKIESKIAKKLRTILRDHYYDFPSAVKSICAKTGVHERAVRNWYDGRNPPSSGHFLVLARSYPAVLQMMLELAGRPDLAAACMQESNGSSHGTENAARGSEIETEGAIFCTINVTISLNMASQLNQRQLWFLGMLQQGYVIKAEHIITTWNVSLRTAKYDIATMAETGLIRFVGARRTGSYEINLRCLILRVFLHLRIRFCGRRIFIRGERWKRGDQHTGQRERANASF